MEKNIKMLEAVALDYVAGGIIVPNLISNGEPITIYGVQRPYILKGSLAGPLARTAHA